jgi:uncharacterized integral membrane protein (TIGR00698 family)
MMETEVNTNTKKKFAIHEDWVAVILGFGIIALFLSGINFTPPPYSWNDRAELLANVRGSENLSRIALQFFLVLTCSILGALMMKRNVKDTLKVFPLLYVISIIAMVLAGNSLIKSINLEAVIFSLTIGLIIGNVTKLPEWFRSALSTEMFVKIGLVLLGTGVLFGDILKSGSLGLIQALIVVLAVWYFAFWICKKLKLDDELSMMISSAVSICGVSAAIATAGAIKGDSKKLSYVISLVLVTAIPMMIFMPYLAKSMGLSQEVTGAWLGGTIDTTGAVVAAGKLVGKTALDVAAIVKFSQNVLLGLAAFAISLYWAYSRKPGQDPAVKPSLGLLWERFPKFVLGFVGASLLFSFVISPQTVAASKEGLKSLQTLWFTLAFTSIGLETKFSDLFNSSSRKPLYAFLTAQLFNILFTLVIAWLLFGS